MKACINVLEVLNSQESKEYRAACVEINRYLKKGQVETPKASKRYKKAIENYRLYLDKKNIRLPDPIYPINKKDKSTLKYLDVITRETEESVTEYVRMIINPKWVYRKPSCRNPVF